MSPAETLSDQTIHCLYYTDHSRTIEVLVGASSFLCLPDISFICCYNLWRLWILEHDPKWYLWPIILLVMGLMKDCCCYENKILWYTFWTLPLRKTVKEKWKQMADSRHTTYTYHIHIYWLLSIHWTLFWLEKHLDLLIHCKTLKYRWPWDMVHLNLSFVPLALSRVSNLSTLTILHAISVQGFQVESIISMESHYQFMFSW